MSNILIQLAPCEFGFQNSLKLKVDSRGCNLSKEKRAIFQLLIVICCGALVSISNGYTVPIFQSGVHKKIRVLSEQAHMSLLVADLKTNKIILSKNANHYMQPASTLKLFTAYAALKQLGAKYQFKTYLALDGSVIENKYVGNLILHFSGDPSLSKQDLADLFKNSFSGNINKISGDLVIEDGEFDQVNHGPGITWNEVDECYAAPISAIIINKNCITGMLTKRANKIYITLEDDVHTPIDTYIKIQNNCGDAQEANYNQYFVGEHEVLELEPSDRYRYHLSGCVAPSFTQIPLNFAVKSPRNAAINVIKGILSNQGIELAGKIKFIKHYRHKKTLVRLKEHRSADLSELIMELLKESDNIIANALFKKLSSTTLARSGNWLDSEQQVKLLLKAQITGIKDAAITDGAGLSRYDRVQAKQLLQLLQSIYKDQALGRYIMRALPMAGKDGTLAKRFQDRLDKHTDIIAKTGGLTGVATLAGYMLRDGAPRFAFVIMMDGNKNIRDNLLDNESKLLMTIGKTYLRSNGS